MNGSSTSLFLRQDLLTIGTAGKGHANLFLPCYCNPDKAYIVHIINAIMFLLMHIPSPMKRMDIHGLQLHNALSGSGVSFERCINNYYTQIQKRPAQ